MKSKNGIVWFIMLPLIIIGLIVSYFVFKAVIGMLIKAVIWTVGLAILIGAGYILYKIIKSARKK